VTEAIFIEIGLRMRGAVMTPSDLILNSGVKEEWDRLGEPNLIEEAK